MTVHMNDGLNAGEKLHDYSLMKYLVPFQNIILGVIRGQFNSFSNIITLLLTNSEQNCRRKSSLLLCGRQAQITEFQFVEYKRLNMIPLRDKHYFKMKTTETEHRCKYFSVLETTI